MTDRTNAMIADTTMAAVADVNFAITMLQHGNRDKAATYASKAIARLQRVVRACRGDVVELEPEPKGDG